MKSSSGPVWSRFSHIQVERAAERIRGAVRRTPLVPLDARDVRIELRGKLENRQVTGSFKARGAWNQIVQLAPEALRAGVVCASSGNHGQAVAWAAKRAGVPATIVMPKNAYANKIEACRSHGAQVVLTESRELADAECAQRITRGMTLVHPYDAERTLEGAGTVGLEIAEDWPEVDVVLVNVGGGGLVSGSSLALRNKLGARVRIFGVEPEGAPTMTRGLAQGAPVRCEITSAIQGLTPTHAGQVNIDICRATLDGTLLLTDAEILAGQEQLVRQGETVEPAGAAAFAALIAQRLPAELFAGRSATNPLRVAVVVSGGNPEPAQLAALVARIAEQGT